MNRPSWGRATAKCRQVRCEPGVLGEKSLCTLRQRHAGAEYAESFHSHVLRRAAEAVCSGTGELRFLPAMGGAHAALWPHLE